MFLSTPESEYKVVFPDFKVILTVFATVFPVVFSPELSSIYPPVMDLTLIFIVIVFDSS